MLESIQDTVDNRVRHEKFEMIIFPSLHGAGDDGVFVFPAQLAPNTAVDDSMIMTLEAPALSAGPSQTRTTATTTTTRTTSRPPPILLFGKPPS